MMKTNTRMNILISGLALAIFMSSLDTSVVNIVLPTLVKAFDSTFSEVRKPLIQKGGCTPPCSDLGVISD